MSDYYLNAYEVGEAYRLCGEYWESYTFGIPTGESWGPYTEDEAWSMLRNLVDYMEVRTVAMSLRPTTPPGFSMTSVYAIEVEKHGPVAFPDNDESC